MTNPWNQLLLDELGDTDGGGGTAVATPPADKAPEVDYKAQLAQLEKERDEAKAAAREQEEAARFWHQKARGSAESKPAKTEEPEPDTDLLEVAAKGPKAMEGWLKKQGFVRADEVDAMVTSRASAMQREAAMVAKFPELKDQESDFFRSTKKEYQTLTAQGVPEIVAMEIAAERVGLRAASGATKKETPVKKDDADRVARARAAAGEGTRGRQARSEDEDSDELSAEQKAIADAFDISHDAYKKRAKDGVRTAVRN